MPFDNVISRADSQALVPEVVSNAILTSLESESAAMTMFRQIDMSTGQTRMPILAALPTAYFVNGDTGLKQTTEVDWANKFLNAEELAAIVPIPEKVLDDTSFDMWGTIRPLLTQALSRALDAAVFFGANKPSSWPLSLAAGAIAVGNNIVIGKNSQTNGGIAEDLSDLMGTVEGSGYDPNGFVTSRTFRVRLRGARDAFGQRLLDVAPDGEQVLGQKVQYALTGLWPSGTGAALVFTGDFTQAILGVRQDIEYKVLTEAAIFDNSSPPQLIYNLPQQDMVALRVTARFGFQVANTINYQQPNAAQRYPFGVLQST